MNPYFPKFGAMEDAPGYGYAASDDRCETCAAYRNLGPRGFCEKFSFMADPQAHCDDYVPAGTIKQSSFFSSKADNAKEKLSKKTSAVKNTLGAAARLDAKAVVNEANKERLVPTKYQKALDSLKMYYSRKEASVRSAFREGLHPISGGVVNEAVADHLDPNTTAEDMLRRRRAAMLGGTLSGGVLVPGAIAVGLGAARGAKLRKINPAVKASLYDTFHRGSTAPLVAGASLGALGAKSQYDVGTTLADLAKDKVASTSIKNRLRTILLSQSGVPADGVNDE